jgi:hypothetical protein
MLNRSTATGYYGHTKFEPTFDEHQGDQELLKDIDSPCKIEEIDFT